ncbi:MAG: hypothetical protein ACT4NY_32045 [Pseudonocardiales bacterium]
MFELLAHDGLTDAHSQYWDEGSSSLKNIAAIITGNDVLVK